MHNAFRVVVKENVDNMVAFTKEVGYSKGASFTVSAPEEILTDTTIAAVREMKIICTN